MNFVNTIESFPESIFSCSSHYTTACHVFVCVCVCFIDSSNLFLIYRCLMKGNEGLLPTNTKVNIHSQRNAIFSRYEQCVYRFCVYLCQTFQSQQIFPCIICRLTMSRVAYPACLSHFDTFPTIGFE